MVVASYSQNAFGCSNQAKNRKDTSISFHVFPKDNRLRRAWIQAVGRTSLPKSPRLCSEYFDAYCFEYTVRLQNELLGSCPWKLGLFLRSFPTNQPDLPALLVVDAPRRDNDKRVVSTAMQYHLTSLWYICFEMSLHFDCS